jgi:polyhydroxybutyrate depolymerase
MRCPLAICVLLGSSAAGADVSPSDTCETPPRRQAESVRAACYSMSHDGLERAFRVYPPVGRDGPLPLLFVLHGGGGSAGNMEWLTANAFERIADRDGVLVVYPEGIGNSWNDGRQDLRAEAAQRGIDDVGFLRALPGELAATFAVDLSRVYSTGISNGGFMSFRLACDAADVFAAVAPVTANLSADVSPQCMPARPISVAIVNGTEDPLVPWGGGQVRVLFTRRGEVLSTMATLERWREIDDCGPVEAGRVLDNVADDETTLRRHRSSCARGTELLLFEIVGGGHTWPGGVQYLPELLVGRTSRELEASEAIWEFLRRFRLESGRQP